MPHFMRRVVFGVLLLAAIMRTALAEETVVFAAASLTDTMQDIDHAWVAAGHGHLSLSFAASSVLARQLEQGAQVSIFISADQTWMDWAQQRDLIVADSRRALLGNSLVLVMEKDRVHPVTLGPELDLTGLLGPDGRMAVGDPATVPAGTYARQALESLGLWSRVEPHLARAENVRAALLLVQRGEALAGIVYATDAAASPAVAVAATFPASSHQPIIYPAALVRSGATPTARALMEFLSGPDARAIFRARGFLVE